MQTVAGGAVEGMDSSENTDYTYADNVLERWQKIWVLKSIVETLSSKWCYYVT